MRQKATKENSKIDKQDLIKNAPICANVQFWHCLQRKHYYFIHID